MREFRVRNLSFSNVRVNCGTLVDARSISPMKPVDGFTLTNVTGNCTAGMTLANINAVKLGNIKVTRVPGALLRTTNVQGIGIRELQ